MPKKRSGKEKETALSTSVSGTTEAAGFGLISAEKMEEKIRDLRARTSIMNDRGEEAAFTGEDKEVFISAFEQGYPVIDRALTGLYALGEFLHGVRKKLKPRKLYHTWLEYAGIPQGTAQNYVQAYRRYGEELPRFAPLGIKKLLIASRLPNCVEYVQEHEQDIAAQSAQEFEKKVKEIRKKKKDGRGGRKPVYIEVGGYRIRPSLDGNRLTIEGITPTQQSRLIEAVKGLLSQENNPTHHGGESA